MKITKGLMWMAAGMGAGMLYEMNKKSVNKTMNKAVKEGKKLVNQKLEDMK